jgi:two-component system phosphate regulon sensor histidine kinase PhoR
LYRLTDAAEAVAAGDYQQRIPVGTADEVGTLARAVDHMRRALTWQVTELRDNSQRLETVLSSMLEGVLAVNAEQRVLFANDASRSLLGIETREVSGRPLLEVTRNRVVREAVEEAFRLDEPYEFEFQVSGLNRRYLAVRATRLPGEPCPGVVVVLYDITDLRRLENVRREFVANVSHELKTPLSAIKAYAETLRMGAIHDAEHNELFVARIEEQADRLHQLIQDLLHLARVESGREAFDIRDVSLAQVIEGCLPTYRERAQAKQLTLEIEPSPVDVVIRADEGGLTTILDNLVGNAIQYTPQGGRVVIRCRSEGESGVFEVEDTGVGISPRDQTRIFERFYRVDKARSRELGGTGLGLAIVKHLTQAFGGQVSVRSELGKGSVFQIRLPLAK